MKPVIARGGTPFTPDQLRRVLAYEKYAGKRLRRVMRKFERKFIRAIVKYAREQSALKR